jgi:hypothetical protein
MKTQDIFVQNYEIMNIPQTWKYFVVLVVAYPQTLRNNVRRFILPKSILSINYFIIFHKIDQQ